MKILRDDVEGVPGDADDGAEIDLAGGDDEGGREEDEDDVEDHAPEGENAEVDVYAEVDVDAEDGHVEAHGSVQEGGDAEEDYMTLVGRSVAESLQEGLSLCPKVVRAPKRADRRAYWWSY